MIVPLQDAIAQVKSVARWRAWMFCDERQLDAGGPEPIDHAIAAILNAVVSGEMVPAPAVPDDVAAIVAELRGWNRCWPAPGLEITVAEAADTIEALAASVDRANALNMALAEDVGNQAAELAWLRDCLEEIAGMGFSEPMTWCGTETEWERRRANIMQDIARAALTHPMGD